jgi:GNAT superfamily N-acetyltransferase
MARCKRIEVYDEPEILWTSGESRSWRMFNSVVRAHLDEANVDPAIVAVIDRARDRNVDLLWWTGPSTKPADMGGRLEAHGFLHIGYAAGMAVDLLELPERIPPVSDFIVRQVQNINELKIWSRVCATGLGMPEGSEEIWRDLYTNLGLGRDKPMSHFIGWWRDEPVSTSSVLLAAGVAGLNNVATVPAARRRGFGQAVSRAPLEDARSLGYRTGVLQSSAMAEGVYRRLGFRKYCQFSVYRWSENNLNSSEQ